MKILTLLFFLVSIIVLSLAVYIGWFFYMKVRYKTLSSNEAGVVTGGLRRDSKGDGPEEKYVKVVRGGHRLRMFEQFDRIPLKSFQLKIDTPKVYTAEGVGIYGQAVATIKTSSEDQGIKYYAEQFLGKKQNEIESEVEEVLGSNLRAILSKMTIEEINSDREKFNNEVREIAQEQLDRMGFEITSLGLTDLRDDEGYLENLGKPQVAKVKKVADIAEAENERETELKRAEVREEIEKERLQREMSIAEAKKEKDLKDARILAQTEKERAIAEASYELEQEERRLGIEMQRLEIKEKEKANELKLKEMERDNEVRLQERQVQLESKLVEVKKQQADAEFYAKKRNAEAEAEAEKLKGEAEAEVIKKIAEAEVEALKARAEAMDRHKDVLITEKLIEMLPQYAKAVSNSFSNVESIRILDGGRGDQLQSLPNTVTSMMTNMNEGLGQMTGLNLNEIVENMSKPSQINTANYSNNPKEESNPKSSKFTNNQENSTSETENDN